MRSAIEVIPVVDIKDGEVVRAVRGERDTYRPIRSRLCHGSAPSTVGRALVDRCAARVLYVADLDALTGRAPQIDALLELADAVSDVEIWLDGGFGDQADWNRLAGALGAQVARVAPVFASEALATPDAARRALCEVPQAILSLDQRHGRALDAAGCWRESAAWPSRVIVMTLDRVGADQGPDVETLGAVRARAPRAFVAGAGGVRDAADLETCARAGASAWLVASALHDLRLRPDATAVAGAA